MSGPDPITPQSLLISQIHVEQLFGEYTYDLHSDETDVSKLLILYGDNGSGKTTILNCLFHMLSPATNRGHRAALGRIPFRRFAVNLGSRTAVIVERAPGSLIGTFDMAVVRGDQSISRRFEFDASLKLQTAKRSEPSQGFTAALQGLGLRIHLLSRRQKNCDRSSSRRGKRGIHGGLREIF